MQEQIGRESVEPVDAARVSSWLGATGETAARGQHAVRQLAELQKQNAALKKELEKVKDAPQVEDDDIPMKKAANKQLFTVIYYLGSIDSMIRLYFPRLYILQLYLVSRRMTGRDSSRLTLYL